MTNPKVSLIITYNNNENTIKSCIESVLSQNFKDFELICVNNASADLSENIILELTKDIDFVKRISLPSEVDAEEAKTYAVALSSGDFVCFLDADKTIDESLVSKLFTDAFSVKNKAQKLITEKMYKREFLENIDTIDAVIEDKINSQSDELKKIVLDYEKFIKTELEKNAKSNIENVSNKNFELICRFNQLEKNVYDNFSSHSSILDEKIKEVKEEQKCSVEQFSSEISKVYDYINSEINKKGSEINRVYEDITTNYKYTEQIVSQIKDDIANSFKGETNYLKEKIENLEKDIILRHVNIKRLFDIQVDELDSRIKSLNGDNSSSSESFNAIEVSKMLEENVEKIYAQINKTNSQFYAELTNIYKEINEKLISKMQEQQYSFDKKIEELRVEFNQKIEEMKGN